MPASGDAEIALRVGAAAEFGKSRRWLARLAARLGTTMLRCSRSARPPCTHIPSMIPAMTSVWRPQNREPRMARREHGLQASREPTSAEKARQFFMSLSSTSIPACARLVLCAFSVASADALLQRKQRAQARMPVLQILACYRAYAFGVASADALLQRKQRTQERMPVLQILACYRLCAFSVASADVLLQRKQRAQARMPVLQILSCYRALVHRDAKAGR